MAGRGRKGVVGSAPRAEAPAGAAVQVRLSPAERARAAAVLRDGEPLADLVREGIDLVVSIREGHRQDLALAELGRAVAALVDRYRSQK